VYHCSSCAGSNTVLF
nr:immunoglobulin light chain junction region [Macaca mulatta]MOW67350.1 immunoglobulin light chain junction region [Macaca mulatta]MOW67373.1 immunoglobulin light chain junction region [Macaca mulatta]